MPTPHTPTTRILLIDEHAVVRAGLRMLIESQPYLKIVGEAANRTDALAAAAEPQPDIVLLTGSRDQEAHLQAVRQGAMGVVLKEQAADVLVKAIQKVQAGEAWIDPALTVRLLTGLASGRGAAPANLESAKIAKLTEREREVITLLA